MNLDTVLAARPWVEVFVKSLYWRSAWVNKLLARRARSRSKTLKEVTSHAEQISFELISDKLRELGVCDGRIMIVHSSWLALNPTGLSPTDICERLVEFLGPDGTLAMPAFPFYRGEPSGPERLRDSSCAKTFVYDVRKTPPWTGSLPKALMGVSGAIRSRHPLNSMVAVGKHAASMMHANIDGDRPMACGPGSSWKFCADRNAAIVCLGVDTAHSLTMIHVAEDSWADQWPIENWYRDRMFHVRDGDFETTLTVRERRPLWAINYAERTLQKDLIAHGILNVAYVGGLRIETCDSSALINFLNKRNSRGYPYWFPIWSRALK